MFTWIQKLIKQRDPVSSPTVSQNCEIVLENFHVVILYKIKLQLSDDIVLERLCKII